ncbi:DMT family transporter [Nocardioides sp. CER19]|uniref:DMT family transporter n=1 Tax=Nocardioides sp. CER19 TaxID=3038538 RepID=UPI00244C94FE|nr:DMT family transporter [Nocardioides sp. CER19]MDH2414474.1 DMT family transporter [Nocardioides sp. CER19]
MSRANLVIVLALVAALAFAVSAFLQRRASEHESRESISGAAQHGLPGAVALTLRLVRRPVWMLGWGVNLAGFGVQALALSLGSVAAVQPVLTAQLLFTMVLASWERRRWPTVVDWLSGLAICGGIAILLSVDGAAPLGGVADRSRVLWAVGAAVVAGALLVSTARILPSVAVSAVLLACAAGLAYALSAVFMKLTASSLVDDGVGATARDWVGYSLAVSTLLGLVLGQAAYAAGPLPWAVAAMNIVNPAASFAIGVLAFETDLPSSPGDLAALTGTGALLLLGVIGLVRSPSRGTWTGHQLDQDVRVLHG